MTAPYRLALVNCGLSKRWALQPGRALDARVPRACRPSASRRHPRRVADYFRLRRTFSFFARLRRATFPTWRGSGPDPMVICDQCKVSEADSEKFAVAEGWLVDYSVNPHTHVCPECLAAAPNPYTARSKLHSRTRRSNAIVLPPERDLQAPRRLLQPASPDRATRVGSREMQLFDLRRTRVCPFACPHGLKDRSDHSRHGLAGTAFANPGHAHAC